jgi:cytochrome b subunit of formate dehydrogenase
VNVTDAQILSDSEKGTLKFIRFTSVQRFQHLIQLLTFTLLGSTGLAIKFYTNHWVQKLIFRIGGFDVLLSIHLVAGMILTWLTLYHMFYLTGQLTEKNFRLTMLPKVQDVIQLGQNIAYLVGIKKVRPKFERYSYREKMDYLAEWWGMFVMISTGLILWFPGQIGQFLPRWMLDVAQTIHSYEAMLAIMVILIWHLFSVALSPNVFPMSMVWLTGKISEQQLAEEHPAEFADLTGRSPEDVQQPKIGWFKLALAIVEIVLYFVILLLILKAFLPGALE